MKLIFTLVGMQYRGSKELVAKMKGDTPLELKRDPDNVHDPYAVAVWHDNRHIAFIKGTEASELAKLMDSKHMPSTMGRFVVTASRWPQVEVDV